MGGGGEVEIRKKGNIGKGKMDEAVNASCQVLGRLPNRFGISILDFRWLLGPRLNRSPHLPHSSKLEFLPFCHRMRIFPFTPNIEHITSASVLSADNDYKNRNIF